MVIDDALAPLVVGQELGSIERLAERMRLFTRRRLGIGLDESAVAGHPCRRPGARLSGTRGGLPDRFVGDR